MNCVIVVIVVVVVVISDTSTGVVSGKMQVLSTHLDAHAVDLTPAMCDGKRQSFWQGYGVQ